MILLNPSKLFTSSFINKQVVRVIPQNYLSKLKKMDSFQIDTPSKLKKPAFGHPNDVPSNPTKTNAVSSLAADSSGKLIPKTGAASITGNITSFARKTLSLGSLLYGAAKHILDALAEEETDKPMSIDASNGEFRAIKHTSTSDALAEEETDKPMSEEERKEMTCRVIDASNGQAIDSNNYIGAGNNVNEYWPNWDWNVVVE